MTEPTEAKSSKEVKGYKISSKRVVGVALYQGKKGIVPLPIVENQRVTQRGFLAILEPLHPARFVQVIASADAKVLKEGFDWPGAEQDWDAIAAEKFAAYRAEQARERQAKATQKKVGAEREVTLRELAEAVKREPFNFANESLFQTPNSQVAQKVRDLYPSAFIDAVLDDDNHLWHRFTDVQGEIRDSVCPSCGSDDIALIWDSSTGLISRVCHSQDCNFRWADKPQQCPVCHFGELEVEMDARDVYVRCDNRQNCQYQAKLGRLPRIPADEEEPTLRASAVPGRM
jgi:rubrerythrin